MLATMLAALLPHASAQDNADPTHVTVNVSAERLESLLTDEQKQSVTHLTVTGTLQEADYAYLRSGLLGQLTELNLRDADIDTIPAHAFHCTLKGNIPDFEHTIVLPVGLKHLSNYSLSIVGYCSAELTGAYPTLGRNVFNEFNDTGCSIMPSESNDDYKMDLGILISAEGDIIYRNNNFYMDTIPDHAHTIYANAFENCMIVGSVSIPATVDSIGDMAFANMQMGYTAGAGPIPYLLCRATTPPKLGKDVFLDEKRKGPREIYVPDESVDLYKSTEGWKDKSILGLSVSRPAGIKGVQAGNPSITVTENADAYILQADKNIIKVILYDATGRLLSSITTCSLKKEIPRNTLLAPVSIARVNFADGTSETLKLMP